MKVSKGYIAQQTAVGAFALGGGTLAGLGVQTTTVGAAISGCCFAALGMVWLFHTEQSRREAEAFDRGWERVLAEKREKS